MKYQIYISYREENVYAAKALYDEIQGKGYSVFFKDKNLKNEKSEKMLLEVLNECQNFILLLTPDSLIKKEENDWMYKEVLTALEKKKNIIPIALYEINEFPKDLNQELADLKTCHIIKFIGNVYFWWDLYGAIIGEAHLLSMRNKFASFDENANLRKLIYTILIAGTIWIVECIAACMLHYTFKESWKLPSVFWSICNALSEISVFQIIESQLLHAVVIGILYWSLKKDSIHYALKTNQSNNINIVDFDDPVECVHIKLNTSYSSKRSKEKKEAISKDDNGEWNCFEENKGLIVGYLDGQYTTYMELCCRKWPKVHVCGVGSRTTRKTAIAMMEDQGIKYIGNQNQDNGNGKGNKNGNANGEVLYFEKDDINFAILYGRVWPKIIEMKRQYVQSALDEYKMLHNFAYEDEEKGEENTGCKYIFRRQFQYNGQIYLVLQAMLKNKRLNKYTILRKDVGDEYIFVGEDEGEKVLKAFERGR